jgi:chromosome partitioning protein
LEGLTQLLATFEKIKKSVNKELYIEGVLFTMFDGRTNLSLQVVEEVKRHFKHNIFRTLIPRNIKLGEAPSHGLPIALYDKKCLGCLAYEELADELLEGDEK